MSNKILLWSKQMLPTIIVLLIALLFGTAASVVPTGVRDIGLICLGIGLLIASELWWLPFKLPTEKDLGLSSLQATKLQEAERQIEAIDQRLDEIREEGAGLYRHLDGSYDRKSELGKALNAELQQKLAARLRLREFSQQVRYGPLDAWRVLLSQSSKRMAWRWAVLGGAPALFVAYLNGGADITPAILIGWALGMVGYLRRRARVARFFADEVISLEQLANGRDLKPEDIVPGDGASTGLLYQSGKARASQQAWYERLGLSANVSSDEILAAWRERITKPHSAPPAC